MWVIIGDYDYRFRFSSQWLSGARDGCLQTIRWQIRQVESAVLTRTQNLVTDNRPPVLSATWDRGLICMHRFLTPAMNRNRPGATCQIPPVKLGQTDLKGFIHKHHKDAGLQYWCSENVP